MIFAKELQKLNACSNAVKWVGQRSLKTAWAECERADWMLWLCAKRLGKEGWPTRQELVLAACDCAKTVKHLWPKNDDRPAKAIKTARAWAQGKATLAEVRGAAYAAANAAYAAADAAANAADAAADAAYAAYAAANAAYAAADAADAAADAAANAADAAANAAYAAADAADAAYAVHIKMCALIRKRLQPKGTK